MDLLYKTYCQCCPNRTLQPLYGIVCTSSLLVVNKGATIFAKSNNNDAGIFCSGTVVNRGAKIDGEMDAIGGVHNQD